MSSFVNSLVDLAIVREQDRRHEDEIEALQDGLREEMQSRNLADEMRSSAMKSRSCERPIGRSKPRPKMLSINSPLSCGFSLNEKRDATKS